MASPTALLALMSSPRNTDHRCISGVPNQGIKWRAASHSGRRHKAPVIVLAISCDCSALRMTAACCSVSNHTVRRACARSVMALPHEADGSPRVRASEPRHGRIGAA